VPWFLRRITETRRFALQAAERAAATGEHGAGLLGSHPGKSFFAAFAMGIVKGDGILGSLGDGVEGVIVGRVAEALASRAGLDPNTASTVAAAATPYIVGFIKSKLAG